MSTPFPPLPPAPTDSFSAQANIGALIALRANRTAMEPNPFPREGQPPGTLVPMYYLDVWVLDGPNGGQTFYDSKNSSALGKQFASVVGDGQVYYGRVATRPAGQGTSLYLRDPNPGDEGTINWHRQAVVAELAQRAAATVAAQQAAQPVQQPWGQPQPQPPPAWAQQPQPAPAQQPPWSPPPAPAAPPAAGPAWGSGLPPTAPSGTPGAPGGAVPPAGPPAAGNGAPAGMPVPAAPAYDEPPF